MLSERSSRHILLPFFDAPFLAAVLHYPPMLDTDSALLGLFDAPFLAAALHYRPMLDTDSALFYYIAAPFLAAVSALTHTPLLVMPHA